MGLKKSEESSRGSELGSRGMRAGIDRLIDGHMEMEKMALCGIIGHQSLGGCSPKREALLLGGGAN